MAETLLSREEADALLSSGDLQYSWYHQQSLSAESWLSWVTWLGIGFGLLASAMAAFPPKLLEGRLGSDAPEIMRWFIAVATLFVTLFSGTLASRYRKLASDREKGRIATALAINVARTRLMYVPMALAERAELLELFERDLLKIEADHGTVEGRGGAGA